MLENDLSGAILGAAIEIHKHVGPGLLESVYETAFAYELKQSGMDIRQQVPTPFRYKDIKQDIGYRIDLLVDNKV
jgi:GxxExxY protein